MQIILQNLLDLATAEDAFPELDQIPLQMNEVGGVFHLSWSNTCPLGRQGARTSCTLGQIRRATCPVCARESGSISSARGYYRYDLVETWVSARRWLSKPTRARGETQVKRTHQVEQTLRSARLGSTPEPWRDVLVADLEAMLPRLSGRIGSREDALAAARAVVARSVGGDAALLDETPMLVTLRAGYSDVSEPTVEALRRQCALRSEQGFRVVALPAWAVTYLLRRSVCISDFAPAGEDEALIHTAVALYSPADEGPLGLLCSALATARNALAA